jgi:hypothetical protein
VTADLSVMAIANCIGTASESMEPLSHIVAWVACPGSAQLRTASVKLQTPNACFAACTGSDSFDADTPTKSSDLEIRMLTVADISAYGSMVNVKEFWSIGSSWSSLSAAPSGPMKLFITRTATARTTDSKTSNSGPAISLMDSASRTNSSGHGRSSLATAEFIGEQLMAHLSEVAA